MRARDPCRLQHSAHRPRTAAVGCGGDAVSDVWNASKGGDVTLEAATNDGAPTGLNLKTNNGGAATVNGKRVLTVDMLPRRDGNLQH